MVWKYTQCYIMIIIDNYFRLFTQIAWNVENAGGSFIMGFCYWRLALVRKCPGCRKYSLYKEHAGAESSPSSDLKLSLDWIQQYLLEGGGRFP